MSETRSYDLGELLRVAGRRPPVPEPQLRALTDAARVEWQKAVTTPRRTPAPWWFAAAAAVVLALGVTIWWRTTHSGSAPPAVIASLERWQGKTAITGMPELTSGGPIAAGAELSTGAGRSFLAVRVAGRSVRLAAETQGRLLDATTLELRRGAIYIDSGNHPADKGVEIRTPLGSIREIGTRFEVRLLDAAEPMLRVRVREGEVELEADAERARARAGEELRRRHGETALRGQIAPHDVEWLWVVEAAPPLTIEGARLGDVLDQLSREAGWSLAWADSELERTARAVVLHGSVYGMTPAETVEVVVRGSGFEYSLESGILRIERAAAN
jgi:hypothetical protein